MEQRISLATKRKEVIRVVVIVAAAVVVKTEK